MSVPLDLIAAGTSAATFEFAAVAALVVAAPDVDVLLLLLLLPQPTTASVAASTTSTTETCLGITDLLDGRAPDRAKHRSVQRPK